MRAGFQCSAPPSRHQPPCARAIAYCGQCPTARRADGVQDVGPTSLQIWNFIGVFARLFWAKVGRCAHERAAAEDARLPGQMLARHRPARIKDLKARGVLRKTEGGEAEHGV